MADLLPAAQKLLDDSYESDLTEKESERLLLMSEHAIAPPLSPVARAVWEAFNSRFDWIDDGVPGPQFNAIAAALRVAASQLTTRKASDQLRAIAAELEGADG